MPLVRSIAREAQHDDYRFESIVLGIVRSDAFMKSMNPAVQPTQMMTRQASVVP
jgi:hypothetical protein